MSLPPVQLQRIRDRAPGWERDWEALLQELLPAIHARSRTARYHWNCDDDRLDFVSEILNEYQTHARNGTLLAGWDGTRGSALDYLTGRKFDGRAMDFLAELAVRRRKFAPLVIRDEDGEFVTRADPAVAQDAIVRHAAAPAQPDWDHLRLRIPERGGISRVVQAAGVQLYPRLDWDDAELRPLMDRLRTITAKLATPECDGVTALRRLHGEAQRGFEAKEGQLLDLLDGHARRPDGVSAERLRKRLASLRRDRLLWPLEPVTLGAVLGISRNNTDQILNRYRAALPGLLPDITSYYGGVR